MRRQLVVLARWPVPGRCKRRLAAGVGNRRAALVQERLCRHALACGRALDRFAGSVWLPEIVLAADALGPGAARRWAQRLGADRGLAQGPGGLGLRMQRQLQRARREGAQQVVLIGSDLPTLEPADLIAAFHALERSPLVLGPAADGGYWLIGVGPQAAPALPGRLCGGMPWGDSRVLACTVAAARRLGVEPVLLECRADLDRPEDLRPWR